MNKLMIIMRLLEIAPRFLPKGKPKEMNWDRIYQAASALPAASPVTVATAISQGTPPATSYVPSSTPNTNLPTTDETIHELKRRLAKELYRMEMDLAGGGRIAGKPCDCLSGKHHLGLEATAEELVSYGPQPIYNEIMNWLNRHSPEFEVGEIGKRPVEYYQGLSPDLKSFRKRLLGTENLVAMLNNEERQKVVEKAKEMTGDKEEEVNSD